METETKTTIHPLAITFFALFTAVFIIVAIKLTGSFLPEAPQRAVEIGKTAPDFTFPDLNGRQVSLSEYRGKVVLVNIWATWCPPCVTEMPSMQRLYKRFKDQPFEILAISIDASGLEAVKPFMRELNLTFPALLDTAGSMRNVYGTKGVPESVIIDKNGVVAKKIIGPVEWDSPQLIRIFDGLLK